MLGCLAIICDRIICTQASNDVKDLAVAYVGPYSNIKPVFMLILSGFFFVNFVLFLTSIITSFTSPVHAASSISELISLNLFYD